MGRCKVAEWLEDMQEDMQAGTIFKQRSVLLNVFEDRWKMYGGVELAESAG